MEMINNFLEWLNSILVGGVGDILYLVGGIVELGAIVGIIIGLFLVMFRITKVLRWSFLIWGCSILVEVLGQALR